MEKLYCKCGCGTEIKHKIFAWGHNQKGVKHPYVKCGPGNPNWKGGKGYINNDGYHVRSEKNKAHTLFHRVIAEKVLGHPLPPKAVIHHVNGKPAENKNHNFVICENQAYHLLLHKRTRAYKACGHGSWLRCYFCKQYDDPKNIRIVKRMQYYTECTRKYYWDQKLKKEKERVNETTAV